MAQAATAEIRPGGCTLIEQRSISGHRGTRRIGTSGCHYDLGNMFTIQKILKRRFRLGVLILDRLRLFTTKSMRVNDVVNVAGLSVCLLGVYLLLVGGGLWRGVVSLLKRSPIGRVLFERRIPEASFWGLLCLLLGFLLQLLAFSM